MRNTILVLTMSLSLAAQGPPNCNGAGRDLDVRCACVKDPTSKLCEMVKDGFYDPNGPKMKPIHLGFTGLGLTSGTGMRSGGVGSSRSGAAPSVAPARQRQARVVPLAHKDYLRFLQPNAQLIAGVELGKLFRSPDLMSGLFGAGDTGDTANTVIAALKEVDHLWLAIAPPNDVVILMTGKFEQGAAAGMFYAQGIQPVFLTDAHAMMIGPEPSIQAALARLSRPPAAAASQGWAARRAKELSKDHETWIVSERLLTNAAGGPLQSIRKFALGFRLTGKQGVDGEVVADSEAGAEGVEAWISQMKEKLRKNTGGGTGALDSLNVERAGATLRFTATDEGLLSGDSGKAAMSSDFGVDLYGLMLGGLPGAPSRTVAEDKLFAVKEGMKREDVLALVGPPLSVTSIQGLETPRETWTYQIPFGKQYSVRLDGGAVSRPPSR